MKRGAVNARFLLGQIQDPDLRGRSLFTHDEIDCCATIIENHDSWKVCPPKPFPTMDRLALACVEGDILWPLHPIGVLADLDRPGTDGLSKDLFSPARWRKQLEESDQTIVSGRAGLEGLVPAADFIDGTVFRTREGFRLYAEWKQLWTLAGHKTA
jgi:hypothetical protein